MITNNVIESIDDWLQGVGPYEIGVMVACHED